MYMMLMALLATPAGAANMVDNPSFSTWNPAMQAFQFWQPNPSATLAAVAAPQSPPYAASVTQRSSALAGLRQDVRADLSAIGSGQSLLAGLRIQVTQPASVRCQLQITDALGSRTVTLAERTVQDTGVWVGIDGSRWVTWTGSLTTARLVLEVAQPVEGVWPSYVVDDVVLELDEDADRLSSSAELALGTSDANPDTDGDGMPDGWEEQHGFDPAVAQPTGSSDLDPWTDLEEFAAATDPWDDDSVPAAAADPWLSPSSQDVLDLLARGPSRVRNRVLVGQHLTAPWTEYDWMFKALAVQTDHAPAVLALQYDDLSITPWAPVHTAAANTFAIGQWNSGGLVEIKWSPLNPWTQGHYGVHGAEIDLVELLTPGTAVNTTWLDWLDQVGAGLQELEDAGVTVLWRPMSEMNGAWFWWGHRPRQQYVDVWRHMFDYFRDTWKLHNLLWVYESDSSVHQGTPADYYYPGDDYVDVMGHNLYDDDWVLPSDLHQVFRSHPKVYALPQAGPATIVNGTFDNTVMIDGVRDRFPRVSYFSAWNSFPGKKLAIIDNQHAQELMDDPWIRSLEEMP